MAIPSSLHSFERIGGGGQALEPYVFPEAYPRFGRLFVDRLDHLWVMAYPPFEEPATSSLLRSTSYNMWIVDPAGAEWLVLDHDGEALAEVRTPPGLFVLEIGEDYVLGVAKDEFDVETVRLHRLRR